MKMLKQLGERLEISLKINSSGFVGIDKSIRLRVEVDVRKSLL